MKNDDMLTVGETKSGYEYGNTVYSLQHFQNPKLFRNKKILGKKAWRGKDRCALRFVQCQYLTRLVNHRIKETPLGDQPGAISCHLISVNF